MKKNPFKKQSAIDTIVNVGIGGAANVAMDYAVQNIDALRSLESTTINAIKIGVGVLAGTMVKGKALRAAADGIATVGAANLVAGFMDTTPATTVEGLPAGTIGRLRPGNRFARRQRLGVSGLDNGFMGC